MTQYIVRMSIDVIVEGDDKDHAKRQAEWRLGQVTGINSAERKNGVKTIYIKANSAKEEK